MSLVPAPQSKSQYLKKISKKQQQQTRSGRAKFSSSRQLITVNVEGSSGPIRFLVNEEESAEAVIRSVLKVYARQGRLPTIGHESGDFYLCRAGIGGALKSSEAIGSSGTRNFLMCKKLPLDQSIDDNLGRKASWKTWLNKSLNFTISSH